MYFLFTFFHLLWTSRIGRRAVDGARTDCANLRKTLTSFFFLLFWHFSGLVSHDVKVTLCFRDDPLWHLFLLTFLKEVTAKTKNLDMVW